MYTKIPLLSFLLSFFFFVSTTKAQTCNTCTIHISGNDTNSYTLNTGQTLCIDSGYAFTKNITLNGGSICIAGVFSPATFINNGGAITINQNAVLVYRGDFNVGTLQITVSEKSVLNVLGKLTLVSGSKISNKGSINTNNNIILNTGSTLENNGVLNYTSLENNGGSLIGTGSANARQN